MLDFRIQIRGRSRFRPEAGDRQRWVTCVRCNGILTLDSVEEKLSWNSFISQTLDTRCLEQAKLVACHLPRLSIRKICFWLFHYDHWDVRTTSTRGRRAMSLMAYLTAWKDNSGSLPSFIESCSPFNLTHAVDLAEFEVKKCEWK